MIMALLAHPQFTQLKFMANMVTRKTGKEQFQLNGDPTGWTLLDFWQWHGSDVLGNALRGKLAEYIVAKAVGECNSARLEWNAYDVLCSDGCKLEVKSAAYLQSWKQDRLSKISFGIKPTAGWYAETNKYDDKVSRNADVYVFCVFAHKDPESADPLCLDQWQFYVIATKELDRLVPKQKTITLSSLLQLGPAETDYYGLGLAVKKACIYNNK
jgi:hypothetical protein